MKKAIYIGISVLAVLAVLFIGYRWAKGQFSKYTIVPAKSEEVKAIERLEAKFMAKLDSMAMDVSLLDSVRNDIKKEIESATESLAKRQRSQRAVIRGLKEEMAARRKNEEVLRQNAESFQPLKLNQ